VTLTLPVTACLAGLIAAAPGGAAEQLTQAKLCYDEGDFECAATSLTAARAGVSGLTEDQRVETHALSAAVMLHQDKAAVAEAQLELLLGLRHNYRPAGWKKHWLKLLERVRRKVPDRTPPDMTVTSPVGPREGEPATFRVEAYDGSGVDRVELTIRDAAGATRSIAFTSSDRQTWLATLPGKEVPKEGLVVWVSAWDKRGNGTTWGSPAAPQRVAVTPNWAATSKPGPPREDNDGGIHEKWWFWTIVGAVVVGTALGVGLGVGLAEPDPVPAGGLVGSWSF